MDLRGDTERQAVLRDRMNRKRDVAKKDIFVSRIDSLLESGMKVCDIGCGTGHVIQELAEQNEKCSFVGVDISKAMIDIGTRNTADLSNADVFEGDGFDLPFPDDSFDIVITRLAPYSPQEAIRVLRRTGHFMAYGLGPDANREVREFFPDRIDLSSYFFPEDPESWKDEVCEEVKEAGFIVLEVEDHTEVTFQSEEELIDLIEMVPLVEGFDRTKDWKIVQKLIELYGDGTGIRNTWHYCITTAKKP
jgi:SAM-dependent methyltransferase